MTRWQGTDRSWHSRMMLPTARCASGRPAIAATSPYVETRPGGIRRTTERTREAKDACAPGGERHERAAATAESIAGAELQRRDSDAIAQIEVKDLAVEHEHTMPGPPELACPNLPEQAAACEDVQAAAEHRAGR